MVGDPVLVLCACQEGWGHGEGQEGWRGGGINLQPGESPGQGLVLAMGLTGEQRPLSQAEPHWSQLPRMEANRLRRFVIPEASAVTISSSSQLLPPCFLL